MSKPEIANGPASRGSRGGNLEGGLAGQRITLHRKKFHFCIIHIILNKIDVNLTEKTSLPRGVGGYHPHPLLANPGYD